MDSVLHEDQLHLKKICPIPTTQGCVLTTTTDSWMQLSSHPWTMLSEWSAEMSDRGPIYVSKFLRVALRVGLLWNLSSHVYYNGAFSPIGERSSLVDALRKKDSYSNGSTDFLRCQNCPKKEAADVVLLPVLSP